MPVVAQQFVEAVSVLARHAIGPSGKLVRTKRRSKVLIGLGVHDGEQPALLGVHRLDQAGLLEHRQVDAEIGRLFESSALLDALLAGDRFDQPLRLADRLEDAGHGQGTAIVHLDRATLGLAVLLPVVHERRLGIFQWHVGAAQFGLLVDRSADALLTQSIEPTTQEQALIEAEILGRDAIAAALVATRPYPAGRPDALAAQPVADMKSLLRGARTTVGLPPFANDGLSRID